MSFFWGHMVLATLFLFFPFSSGIVELDSLIPGLRAGRTASAKGASINYVAVSKFSSGDCSGDSTLIGLVQNTCIPNFDLAQSPPVLQGYQIYSLSKQAASTLTLTNYALSDPQCAGTPISNQRIGEGKCISISGQLSFTFSSGATTTNLPTVHGLFYVSYSSMAACGAMDQKGLIAVSQLTSTYSVPASYWGEPIKLTCASPSVAQIVAVAPSKKAPTKLDLGACSVEAAGGYAIRLQCFK